MTPTHDSHPCLHEAKKIHTADKTLGELEPGGVFFWSITRVPLPSASVFCILQTTQVNMVSIGLSGNVDTKLRRLRRLSGDC